MSNHVARRLYTDNNADTNPDNDRQSMTVQALWLINQMSQKLHWKIEKNTGKVGEICQPVTVKNPANVGSYFK